MAEEVFKYRAFISYRHVERDRKWARWLIEKLETFRTPHALVKTGAPQRIGHLFRDDDEIPASSDLSHQIQNALEASEFLIVICSPDTPKSKWVSREIEHFRSLGRGDKILALLVDGEPEDSFPPELLRVQQTSTNPHGTQTTEWIDEEPIAADLRPRKGERRSTTERRAFLRIAAGLLRVGYDDLVRREHRRRMRRQRFWGIMAAITLLFSYGLWQYSFVHTTYYRDVGTRWGEPFGIGEINEETASHRHVSYAIDTLYGHVIAMRREGGRHYLVPLTGDGIESEPWNAGVAEWHYAYSTDYGSYAARLTEVELYGDYGNRLRVEKYVSLQNGTAAVSFTDETGGAVALKAGDTELAKSASPEDAQESWQRSQIAQHKLIFTDEGYLKKRMFQTVWGMAARDKTGSYGRSYEYNEDGQLVAIGNLNANGRMLIEKSGIAVVHMDYSPDGDLLGVEWRNRYGKPAPNSYGFATRLYQLDDYGNPVSEVFLNSDGKPVPHSDWGVTQIAWKYDEHGNVTEWAYFDPNKKPVADKVDAVACVRFNYDDYDNKIETAYFGVNGKPTLSNDLGVARFRSKYDERGYLIEERYFGTDGKPALRKVWGIARTVWKYDDNGNQTEERYFGLDGNPAIRLDVGAAGGAVRYNARNQMTQIVALGVDGKLVVNPSWQAARKSFKYDELGRTIEQAYFGIDGRPVRDKDKGAARATWKYDERGNVTSEAYFGTDGKPILSTDNGVARTAWTYDERGIMTDEAYFGIDGKPILGTRNGVAHIAYHYDERGNPIEEDYFGIDGKPVSRKDTGAARLTWRYDEQGNIVSSHAFGPDGREIKPASPK